MDQQTPEQTGYYLRMMEKLQPSLQMRELLKQKIETLKRLSGSDEYFTTRTDQLERLDHINYRIDTIKAEGELHTLEKIIKEKEIYCRQWAAEFDLKIKEVEQNYEKILNRAHSATERGRNPALVKFLANIDQSIIDSGIEYKVNFHFELLKLMGISWKPQTNN